MVRYENKADFKKAYGHWTGGAQHFAEKYSIPMILNQGTNKKGIVTHHYVTKTWGGTTHTDPDAYLAKFDVSINQLAKDLGDTSGKVASAPKRKEKAQTVKSDSGWTGQTLSNGDRGKAVRELQNKLAHNEPPFYPNKSASNNGVDGIYGPNTEDAVNRYQSYYGLAIDGLAGQEVYESLTGHSGGGKKQSSSSGSGKAGKLKIVGVNNAAIVMDKPDRNNAGNLGNAPAGSTYPLNGSVKGKNNPKGYWEITYNGQLGYVSGQYGKQI